MFFALRRLLLVALLAGFASPVSAFAQVLPSPSILLSEIQWAGSAVSLADEWVELTNVTDDPIDLSGWSIEGAASSAGTLVLPDGAKIEPHATYLIANYAAGNEKTTLAAEPNFVTASISLSNSALLLSLRGDTGLIVDRAGDGGGPPAGSSESFLPMTRVSFEDGTLASSWATSEAASPGAVEPWLVPQEESPEENQLSVDSVVPETPSELPDDPAQETVEPIAAELLPEEPVEESIGETDTETEILIEPGPDEPSDGSTDVSITISPAVSIVFPPGTLVINELVSDPIEGQSEWVEIRNPYNTVIPLAGWFLRDASGKQTALPDQLLGWEQYLVITNPAGKLNNDADTIELVDPSGGVIDLVRYGTDDTPSAKDPGSLARDEVNGWQETATPTPGARNLLPDPEPMLNEQEPEEETPEIVEAPSPAIPPEEITPAPAEPIEAPADAPSVAITTIRFSEIYPNTTGNDLTEEFIELENIGDTAVDLAEWTIEDASGKRFRVPSGTLVLPHAFFTLPRAETNIALNNTRETIRLFAPDGTLIDEQMYDKTSRGHAYARIDDVWSWTTIVTPDEPNEFSMPEAPGPSRGGHAATPASASSGNGAPRTSGTPIRSVTIAQALERVDGERVRVQGVVIATPGTLGRQIFYLSDADAGIQIYKYDAAFPELEIGDAITITGTLSSNRGERRIKLGTADTVLLSGTEDVVATSLEIDAVGDTWSGRLVSIQGTVAKRSGDTAVIESNGASMEIRAAPTSDTDLSILIPGSVVSVEGVLSSTTSGFRVLPRSNDDIRIVEPPLAQSLVASGIRMQTDSDRGIGTALFIITAGVIGALAVRRLIPSLRHLYATHRPLRIQVEKTS